MPELLIYGANGYTGRLIAREAAARGLKPTLGGRNRAAIEQLASELDCPACVGSLEDEVLHNAIAKANVVLNCAGPFSQTADTIVSFCALIGTSYLDITGEIDVIEHVATFDADARAVGASLIPAVGFDVVPTDCLAAMLAARLPGATHLALAFTATGTVSPGTAKTVIEGAGTGKARVDGRLVDVPPLWKTRTVPFPAGPREVTTIPWGDLASAFHSTGIPNIETYVATSARERKQMQRMQRLAPLLKISWVRRLAQWAAGRTMKGPNDGELAGGRAEIWCEVRDDSGRVETATLTTPNGYRLTALTAVAAAERVLHGDIAPGFQTPSRAFGAEFILSFEGVRSSFAAG